LGIITVNTLQGIKNVEIAGDEPTEQELDEISRAFPKLETSAEQEVPTDDMSSQEQIPVDMQAQPQVAAPEITQEIEDKSFRYALGRMETDEEKMNLLTQKLGPGTFERTAEDTFVIDAAKVNPSVRMELGLPDQGLLYADRPGFTDRDLFDFAGEAGTPLLGAIGAGVILSSAPILIGMAGVGATAAAFSAGDEAIDYLQGLNKQSLGDVMAKIAKEGVINALGEGAGRAIVGGAARLIKGPGPKYSQARAEEISTAIKEGRETDTGLQAIKNVLYPSPEKVGKQIAQEEALADMRGLIAAGASPAIGASTGKSILGTGQSLSESVMPPTYPGARNSQFIRGVLDDIGAGKITTEEGKLLIDTEAKALAKNLDDQLSDPEEAFKVARRNLDDVITKQLDQLQKRFNPVKGLPTEFSEGLQTSAALFQASSNALYKNAGDLLQGTGTKFNLTPVVDQIKILEDSFTSLGIPVKESSIFNAIKKLQAEGGADISTLQNLKSVLTVAAKDPEVVANFGAGEVGKVIKSLGGVIDGKFDETQRIISQGGKIVPDYNSPLPGSNITLDMVEKGLFTKADYDAQFYEKFIPAAPAELTNLKEGLRLWKEANLFYAEGQEKFNNVAVNAILKNARAKTGGRNLSDLDVLIKDGDVKNLQIYLDAVTPTVGNAARLTEPGADATILQAKALFEEGDVIAGNALLKEAGLDNTTGILPDFVQGMSKEDGYWQTMVKPYLDGLDTLVVQARSGANPGDLRTAIRTDVASQWLKNAIRESTVGPVNRTTIDAIALNNSFKGLGKEVQDTLFGNETANILRESLSDTYLLSAKNADDFARQIDSIGDVGLKAQANAVKQSIDEAAEASQTAVARALSTGQIDSADDLVQAVLKDPKSYDQLVKTFGRDELIKEGGLKDATLLGILKGANFDDLFTAAGQDAIQKGEWGKNFVKVLEQQNKNGVLEKMLGKETFKNLEKLAQDSIKVSNVDRPGVAFAGATARLAGGGAILAAVLGHFGVAFTAGAGLAGSAVGARLFRNPTFLKILTSPQMREQLYNKAIADGIVPAKYSQKNAGKAFYNQVNVYWTNRIIDSFTREGLRITGTTAVGQDRESPQGMMLREASKGQSLPSGISLDELRDKISVDPDMLKQPETDFRLDPLPLARPLSMNASDVERERARMGIAGLIS
jgi:hypothetical protein